MVLNSQLKLVWSPGAAYIHGLTGNVMVPLSSLCCFLSCHFCLLALCLACPLSLFINVCVPVFVSWQNSTYLLIMTHLFLIPRQSPFIGEWLDETQALVLFFLVFFKNIYIYICVENLLVSYVCRFLWRESIHEIGEQSGFGERVSGKKHSRRFMSTWELE